MNPVLILVAQYIRDLLVYDEQLIRIGRQNFERTELEQGFIVVDQLGRSDRIGNVETYNWTTEQIKYGATFKGIVTLDFYGDGAYTRAIEFSLKSKSQDALDLKRSLGINCYNVKGFADLKALTGQQYGERVQSEMTVEISNEVTLTALRIAVPQFEIRTEEGVQNG